MAVQFRRDNLKEIRAFLPIGVDGCRGVFASKQPSGWWDDERAVWPDDAEVAAIRFPDGTLLLEGEWVEVDDLGGYYRVKGVSQETLPPVSGKE